MLGSTTPMCSKIECLRTHVQLYTSQEEITRKNVSICRIVVKWIRVGLCLLPYMQWRRLFLQYKSQCLIPLITGSRELSSVYNRTVLGHYNIFTIPRLYHYQSVLIYTNIYKIHTKYLKFNSHKNFLVWTSPFLELDLKMTSYNHCLL